MTCCGVFQAEDSLLPGIKMQLVRGCGDALTHMFRENPAGSTSSSMCRSQCHCVGLAAPSCLCFGAGPALASVGVRKQLS